MLPASHPDPSHLLVDGATPYGVSVGRGVRAQIGKLFPDDTARVALVHPPVMAQHAQDIAAELERDGRVVVPLVVPPGEAAKDAGVLVYLWSRLADAGFTRTDAVVAVGGGATTDLAGLLAATWLRGVRLVLVPTTLLGMVDAAIGGKSAINIAQGKNLVGAFHQPSGVVCDLDFLSGMKRSDYISGLAEVIKAGLIADPVILDLVEADPGAATDPAGKHTQELVERAVRVKAEVVGADPHESGRRVFLNYGHTLGHAIEHADGYRFPHGHAVSIGMVYAAELAGLDGRLALHHVERHRALLESVGLPTGYPREAWQRLHPAFAVDKKTRGNRVRFVVLDAPGSPALLEDPAQELLAEAYGRIGT
ncbi:3-dehydroquinate synthase [Streptomyces sp. NPDC051956]|uniref:3-dehydroquinate synthase n=1 Tax=Streptomyces sp. NPDC051956 TaxID=3365677 RepID=UPI0037D72094